MFDTDPSNKKIRTTIVKITEAERQREQTLRQHFADFWASATGDLRSIYDTFISASPLADNVTLDAVEHDGVHGWWVRPAQVNPAQTQSQSQAILYLHGGGYVLGSAKAYRGFVSQIVSRTNIPALVIDYPLAPEASLPMAPQAALAAWNWLVAQGFDRIAIVGDSAGGGLTLVTLSELTATSRDVSPVAGLVFSPWTDLTFSGASMKDPNVIDPLIGYEYLQDCANKYCGTTAASDPLASPLFGNLKNLPPLFLQVGTAERLLDDARQYADRAAEAGVSVQLEVWEEMHHVFQLDVAHLDSSRVALDRGAQFLLNAFKRQ